MDLDSVIIAGARWMKYLKRKPKTKCLKDHFLSGFFIGGFALSRCDAILTRDRGIYKKYFPDLKKYETLFKRKRK